MSVLRQATRDDIPGMHRVRMAVRENRLASAAIREEHYVSEIEATGRGWVVLEDEQVVAFAVGNRHTGNIWALFVAPEHEGRGHGRRLHAAMTEWLFAQGLQCIWLSTDPDTRAQRFYEAAGWVFRRVLPNGERYYELRRERVPPEFAHTLVIGGTGMLREATIELAQRSRLLTAISHSRNALRDLGQALAGAPCERRLLSLDWEQRADFLASLQRHVVAAGPPTLAVAWLHDAALGPEVAEALSHPAVRCHFFHVLGSDAADPARPAEPPAGKHGQLEYHRVVLGFRKTERESRWLTHAEISAGVLEAIGLGVPTHVVGDVTPWSERPMGLPVERLQT